MAEIHQYDKSTKHNNYNKTMIAEELRRYYSELKIEDDKDDKGIAEHIRQIIRKIWSYR